MNSAVGATPGLTSNSEFTPLAFYGEPGGKSTVLEEQQTVPRLHPRALAEGQNKALGWVLRECEQGGLGDSLRKDASVERVNQSGNAYRV